MVFGEKNTPHFVAVINKWGSNNIGMIFIHIYFLGKNN